MSSKIVLKAKSLNAINAGIFGKEQIFLMELYAENVFLKLKVILYKKRKF